MGQILDKLQGKEWRRKQIGKITNKIFDRVANNLERANLTFEDLYIAVLLVYNDINKHLPGPHFDPPSKDHVRNMIKDCDVNLDGEIDREEFVRFIQRLTSDTIIVVSQKFIATLVVASTVAMATKKNTERLPGVGKMVRMLPKSVFASLVTLAVVLFQKSTQEGPANHNSSRILSSAAQSEAATRAELWEPTQGQRRIDGLLHMLMKGLQEAQMFLGGVESALSRFSLVLDKNI